MTFAGLENRIKQAYTQGVTMEEAEKFAAECLHAQIAISSNLRTAALDTSMRKSGLKAVRAAVYLETVGRAEKKPTEAQLTATLDTDETIANQQDRYDTAEAEEAALKRMYDIAREAHIYFRGIAKGSFGG